MIDWTTIDIINPLSVTEQTGFTVKENGSGYVKFGDKYIVMINLEISVGATFSGEKTAVLFGNDVPLGSSAPQLSATFQNQTTIFSCGSWLRTSTKGLVVFTPSSASSGGTLRVTGTYIV